MYKKIISTCLLLVVGIGITFSSVRAAPLKNRSPARLIIPRIKVNAKLESVGLTRQGAVGVPKGLTNAGWFNGGPLPGETGAAVITGHFGRWLNGTQGVFNNLSKLRVGDKLYTKNKSGVVTTFVVRKIKNYDKNEIAEEIFISNDDQAHLNLITCAGAWNKITKSYSRRLVVFADKE